MDELRAVLLHKHPNPQQISLNDKYNIIQKIIQLTSFEPEQGSKAWSEGRQIGGSDAAAMLGKGYWGKGPYEVIYDKIFPSSFQGNVATRFGNVFENVGRLIIEKLFGHEVWELKSLPNNLPFTTFSPDGVTIACIMMKLLMVLLEFKTPLNRIPDGKIPKDYIPQVRAGLCTMPFLDGAIFVDTMLRVCSLKDLCYNTEYNTRLHVKDTTTIQSRKISHKDKLEEVLGFGMCVLYQNDMHRHEVKKYYNNENIDPLLLELGITDKTKISNTQNGSIIAFDCGPSFEDELLKTKISNSDLKINERDQLYSFITSKHSTIDLPEFNYVDVSNKDIYDLFKKTLLQTYEHDFGNEIESNCDIMFKTIHEKKLIGNCHIPPYIVQDNMYKNNFLKSCGFKSDNILKSKDFSSKNADYITQDARVYFIEYLNELRKSYKDTDNHIVGVIPYKIFKMEFVFVPNDQPDYMNLLKEPVEIYGKIKTECKEVDLLDIDYHEKNKIKREILCKYFPNKKESQVTEELCSVEQGLQSMLLNDSSMF